jgi:hypothetical protein
MYDTETKEVTTYALWPSSDKQQKTNVRKNIEKMNPKEYQSKNSRYYKLNDKPEKILVEIIETPNTWEYWHTCADWASETIQAVTGEEVDANDWLWIGTPRELFESIRELESLKQTSIEKPLQLAN